MTTKKPIPLLTREMAERLWILSVGLDTADTDAALLAIASGAALVVPADAEPVAWVCTYGVDDVEGPQVDFRGTRPRDREPYDSVQPLYLHPSPDVTELRALLREAREYVEHVVPYWATHERKTALLAKITAALKDS